MMKFRLPLFLQITVVAILLFSCKKNKDKISTDPQASLSFSQEKITFDTIFSAVGSVTKRLWVYNDSKYALNISTIELAGMSSSPYSLIIDGDEAIRVNNIEIKGNDSLQILISVFINPSNKSTAYLLEDSIVFYTNGNVQEVNLLAYGQDATFLNAITLPCNTLWTNTKPYVLSGEITIPAGCTLTVDKGTRVLFHKDATLNVAGTLLSLGEKDSMVSFKHDNLATYYKNLAGQWNGIIFQTGSKNNKFLYTEILNATNAITLNEEIDGDTIAELIIENSKIINCSENGIVANNSDLYVVNSLVNNCIGYLVKIINGGNFYFDYCTMANYSYDFFRDEPIIRLSNKEGTVGNPLISKFRNVIVWGDKEEEIEINNDGSNGFDFTATNSVLKSSLSINGNGNLFNQNPLFESESQSKFYLKTTSPAIDAGMTIPLIPLDLLGETRDLTPDIGCYEVL